MRKTLILLLSFIIILIPTMALAENTSDNNEEIDVTITDFKQYEDGEYVRVHYKVNYNILDDSSIKGVILAHQYDNVTYNTIEEEAITKGKHSYNITWFILKESFESGKIQIIVPHINSVIIIPLSGE